MALEGGAVSVLGFGINTPPNSPSGGDSYFVGPNPSGAWAGHAGEVALFAFGRWWFESPARSRGMLFFDAATGKQYGHDGNAPFRITREADVVFPASFTFESIAASGKGGETSGVGSVANGSILVPAGKSFAIFGYIAQIETGNVNGDYDLDLIVRNVSDSTDVVLASKQANVSLLAPVVVDFSAFNGTPRSPLATIPERKRIRFGWRNRSSSPAALTIAQKTVTVWGGFI